MNLSKKKLQELKDRKISIEDLNNRYFIETRRFVEVENILKLLNENICSFKEIVNKFKNIRNIMLSPCLYGLILDKKFFEELMQSNRLSREDLRYLLNSIDNIDELQCLCWNTSLIKHILNEFVMNTKDVDKFNTIVENTKDVDKFNTIVEKDNWCKEENIHTIFDMIEYENKSNEEILKLNELNKKGYLLNSFGLTKDQKVEISEVLRNNRQVQNTLMQIVENHLEDQYDFESLKNLLAKEDNKTLKSKFNF